MLGQKAILRRIEWNYAGAQSSYWLSMCSYSGFMAVYLAYKGYADTQIGLVASGVAVLTILLQLALSSISDARPNIPLKRTIALLYILAITMAVALASLPLGLGLMALVYAIGSSSNGTISGLLNAQMMQYVNVGIPVNYGWPRGVASIVYAFFALLLGGLIERYSPALLMPIYMVCAVLGIVTVLLMPDVYTLSDRKVSAFVRENGRAHTSYRELLRENTVFKAFLLASILVYTGQAGSLLFLVRVVENLGGTSRELGLGMFIQAAVELPVMMLSGRILKRFRVHDVLSFSFLFYLLRSLTLALAPNMAVVYIALSFNIFCFGIYGFASVYFVNSLLAAGEKVRAQGLVVLCSSFGGIVSSLFSGYVIDHWGLKTMLLLSAGLTAIGLLTMLRCRGMAAKSL